MFCLVNPPTIKIPHLQYIATERFLELAAKLFALQIPIAFHDLGTSSLHWFCIRIFQDMYMFFLSLDDIVNSCLSFLFTRETKSNRENACWPISNKLKIWECDVARNKLRRIRMLGIDLKLWGVTSHDRPLSQFGIWGPPPPPLLLRSSSF